MSISTRRSVLSAAVLRALAPRLFAPLALILLAALASCSDGGDGPVDPGAKAPAELVITPRFENEGGAVVVSRIRARLEDPASGRTLGTLERDLAPGEERQPVTLSVMLDQPLEVRASVELLGAGGQAEWSGRGSIALQPGGRSAHTLDLYRGPVANLDITQLTIVRPTSALAEGDTLRLVARVAGASGAPVLYWSSADTMIATLTTEGLLRAKLPGAVRVRVVAGPKSDTATVVIGARVDRIEITPDSLRFSSLGEEGSVLARALDARGDVVAGAELTWTVADTTVAVSLGGGRIRAVANGQTTITAQSANDPALRATATVVVEQRVASVSVEPAEVVLGSLGETQAFRARALDANGHTITGRAVHWSSADMAVASISAEGVATATGNGATTLTATIDGVIGRARLTVRQAVASVHVTPGVVHLSALDATAQLVASAFDEKGAAVLDAVVTWTSSDPGVARVSIDGVVTAVGNGRAQITALVGSVTSTAEVQVEQVVASVRVAPAASTLAAIGETVQLSASASDANGYAVVGARFTWTSQDAKIATVSADGLVSAVANGATRVQAASGGASAAAEITVEQVPTALEIVAGDGQTGTVAAVLPVSPAVRVVDARGAPVAGVSVTFAVTAGGGSVGDAVQITDVAGNATLGSWTLGTVAGRNALSATVAGIQPLAFTAEARAGAAASIGVHAGDGGSAEVGTTRELQVRVVDAYGNPVAGHTVSWSVVEGGGSLAATSTSDADGVATIRWTLGTTAGTQRAAASSAGLGGSPATFTVNTTPAAASRLMVTTEPAAARIGDALDPQPVVQLQDTYGNAVAQANVAVTVAADFRVGGSLSGQTEVLTDAQGRATFAGLAFLSPPGTYTLSFSAPGLDGAASTPFPVTIGSARALTVLSGDGGTEVVRSTRTLRVRVTDAAGNGVRGHAVEWHVASGGGTMNGAANRTTTTDAGGVAEVEWQLGTAAGVQSATASATDGGGAPLTGAPASFEVTATAGAAAVLSQHAGDGATLPVASVHTLQARVTDAYGNPVAGHTVAWAVTGGGGTLEAPATTTDANGVASARWTLGTTSGQQSVDATAGVGGPASFSVTSTPAAPAQLAISTQPSDDAQSGVALVRQPVVQLQDTYGNPAAVAGVQVTAALASGGGVLGGTLTATTDAAGRASFSDLAIRGSVGARTLRFDAPGLAGSTSNPIDVAAGAPAQLVVLTEPSDVVRNGVVFTQQPRVQVQDADGNTVSAAGVQVAASIASGGGVLGGTATVGTDAAGIAGFTNLFLSGTIGARTLVFSATGLTGTAPVTVQLLAGAPASLAITTQPSATARAGLALARQPVVQLQDASGNAVEQAGVGVSAAIASGGGTLGGALTVTTDASGAAVFGDLAIGGTVGSRTLSFTAAGVTGVTSDPIALTPGAAAALSFSAQPTTAAARAPITPAVQVTVMDGYGNPVTDATDPVTLALGTNPSGATLSGTTTVAAVGGVATFSNLSVDNTGADYTLVANSGTMTAATSAGFDVTHGALDHFLVEAAGGVPIGNLLVGTSFNVRVTARDAYNNTVTDFTGTVGFTSAPGGGISAGATSGAFVAGVLASHSITIATPGSFTLTATRTGGAESGASNTFEVQAPPTAVNEGPAVGSSPGQPFHAIYSTSGSQQTFTLPAPGVLGNDNRGFPVATITSFGADSLGGSVTTYAAGSTVSPLPGTGRTTGSLTVNADGGITFTPPDGFTGNYVFRYRLTNARGTSDARVTIAVGERPVASNDAYPHTLVGNVPINTATSTNFRVTANDRGDGKVLAITGQTNGTATLNADSTFTFRPTPGYEGPASFTYTVSNGFGTSAPATVTMTVANPVWFVNASAGAGGDGRLDAPFNSLAAFQAVNNGTGNNPAANDRIFLYSGNYTSGLTLLDGQVLIGQGATASLSSIAGVTWPADAGPEPVTGGMAPTISTAAASTDGITLGGGNTLRGFNLGNATGSALSGKDFGTLSVAEVAINSTGQALNLTNGTINGSFPVVRSTGGVYNIYLESVATSAPVMLGSSSDMLSGASSVALMIAGGDGSFTYPGTIDNRAEFAVNIWGKRGGVVTLSGDINPAAAGSGINIGRNSGATLNFTGANQKIGSGRSATGVYNSYNTGTSINFTGGGLAIGGVFSAVEGGTVTVTGANNTINQVADVALEVVNTMIGANGLTFRSISADGGTRGIVLNNTGSSGGLTVTGDGVTPGSGGTIRNTVGDDLNLFGNGIYLQDTRDVALNWMQLNDHPNHAIRGINVTNFTLNRTRITGTNGTNSAGGYNEGSVSFDNLTGQAAFTHSYIGGGFTDNVRVVNTAGTLDRIVFMNDTIGHNSTNDGNDGILLESQNRATLNATITDNVFNGARGDMLQFALQSDSRGDLVLERNTFHNTHPNIASGGGGVTVGGGGGATASASLTYRIENNSIQGAVGSALVVSKGGGVGRHSGIIRGNVIGAAGNTALGSQQGSALFVGHLGGGAHTTLIEGNQLYGYNNSGISLQAGDAATGGSGTLDATVRNNTLANPGPFASYGVMLNGGTSAADAHRICVDLRTNALNGSGSSYGVYLRQRQQTTVRLPGYVGANNDNAMVAGVVANANFAGALPTVLAANNVAGGGGGFVGGAACAQP